MKYKCVITFEEPILGTAPTNQQVYTDFIVSKAIENGVQGTVYVSFVVESDGRINEAKVLRGIGSGCDEEALRVVKSMPNWTPGTQRGKPVRVRYNLPIRFHL